MTAYYNEIDPQAAAWLELLAHEKLIAPGVVDSRSIEDVRPKDLDGFTQCHFFAGIGGWSVALRNAGWPDDRAVWTGSCPCQPFSAAGKGVGFADERHLWPAQFHLISQCCPAIFLGEQVANAVDWLRLVRSDLEGMGYAVGAAPIEAASAGAFHLRDRWFYCGLADGVSQRRRGGHDQRQNAKDAYASSKDGMLADADSTRLLPCAHAGIHSEQESARPRHVKSERFGWVESADGKSRPVEPGICLLADRFPGRVGLLRGFGNAIDPRPAEAFIRAIM